MSDANASTYPADSMCRYARLAAIRPDLFHHVCSRRDGRPIRPLIDDCFAEARTEFLELRPEPFCPVCGRDDTAVTGKPGERFCVHCEATFRTVSA